jgi:hypothetical protein
VSENTLISAAKNLVHNPRPVGSSYWAVWSASGLSTATLVSDRSYSGVNSMRYVLNAGETSVTIIDAGNWDDPLWASRVPIGSTISGMIHLSGPVPHNILYARLVAIYTDDTGTYGNLVWIPAGSTDFQRIIMQPIVTTKAIRNVRIEVVNDISVGAPATTFYLGGADIRRNQPVDAFVHGSAGPNYSWEGTVNGSPSDRAAFTIGPVLGSGGVVYPSIRLHVVNRKNQILREITENFIDGSVNYDLDADQWKGSCNLILNDPGLISPFADEYVRVTLRIEYVDGTVEEDSIGMFMVDPPKERWSGGHDQWTYDGKDMLALLSTWMMRGPELRPTFGAEEEAVAASGFLVYAGNRYQAAVDLLLFDIVGLDRSQVAINLGDAIFQQDFAVENGTSVLETLTQILQGAGFQKPWVSPQGIIRSEIAGTDPAHIEPSIVLATGENSRIRWPFDVEPEVSRVGNRVRVFSAQQLSQPVYEWVDPVPGSKGKKKGKKKKKKRKGGSPGQPGYYQYVRTDYWNVPVSVVRANNDPTHPLSIASLGRIIDLPDVNVPLISGEAEAIAIADQALRDASLIPIRVRLTTEVMLRGYPEVYELNMTDAFGNPIASGQGRYWCRGWTLQLGLPWEMTHNLTRVIEFATAAWG